jgi:hypothetical protein
MISYYGSFISCHNLHKFTIKGTNLSEDFTKILYHANFDVIPLLNRLSKINFFYEFKYLCSSLSINVNQLGKF